MLNFQNTIELFSILITTLPVLYLKKLYNKIEACFDTFRNVWKNSPPHTIVNSVHMWFKSLQINTLTEQITNCSISTDNVKIIHGIKLMLGIMSLNKNESVFTDDIYVKIKSWPTIVMRLHQKKTYIDDKFKMAAVTDAVEIALFFMRDREIVKLVIDGQKAVSNDLTFCQKYIAAFVRCLLDGQVLTDVMLQPYLSVLLYEMLVYFGKKAYSKEDCEKLVNLVDKVSNSI